MAERQLTDAWGDRWDVFQDGTIEDDEPPSGPLHFRHQSGRTFDVPADEPLDALTEDELLERLESEISRTGLDRSVLRGIDAKQDSEGYTNPLDRPGVD